MRAISRGKLAAWLRLGKWETAWLRLGDGLVTAGSSVIGIVVKLPCSVAVTDRATGVRRCLGDWTSRDIYLKSYHSDLAAVYLDY